MVKNPFPKIPTTVQFPIANITTDPRLQTRAGPLDEEHVERLRLAILENKGVEPVVLAFDGSNHLLEDGFHRLEAHRRQGALELPALIYTKTFREALWDALAHNASHGLPRNNQDKRRVVGIALADAEWQVKSDRAIAEHCQVSHDFVNRLRREIYPTEPQQPSQVSLNDTSSQASKRVGKDGKSYPSSKPTKQEPFVPSIDQLAASASQKLTGYSLERELLAWAGTQLESEYQPVELVVLLERRDAVSQFKAHLEALRKMFDEKDVKQIIAEVALRYRREMDAIQALKESARNPTEEERGKKLPTFEEYLEQQMHEWLEMENLDLRNLELPQVYQMAFFLGAKANTETMFVYDDFEAAGEIIANLVSGLTNPAEHAPHAGFGDETPISNLNPLGVVSSKTNTEAVTTVEVIAAALEKYLEQFPANERMFAIEDLRGRESTNKPKVKELLAEQGIEHKAAQLKAAVEMVGERLEAERKGLGND